MSTAPFHVLLLAGGNRRKDGKPPHDERDNEDIDDDYLFRRNEFRKKAASNEEAAIVKDFTPADFDCRNNTGSKNSVSSLRNLCSPLESAMAACCERGSNETGDSPSRLHSGLHRPLFPANYVAPESPTSPPQQNFNNYETSTMNNGGILRQGKEGHFLKLLMSYCPKHALGHRALALAILQRTVDWETSNASASKLETVCDPEAREADGHQPHTLSSLRPTSTNIKRKSNAQTNRIRSFLAAGGMKLLAQWLVDSYTHLPDLSNNNRRKGDSYCAQTVASQAGYLLLPLLNFLKCIPFDKNVVLASKIHKSIKRLKKMLDVLVERLDSGASKKKVHDIAGGLPVAEVVAAVDQVMASWLEAAASGESDDTRLKLDPFHQFQAKMQMRFDELVRFQNEGVNPPSWLPKSVIGMRVAPTLCMGKPATSSHALNTTSLPRVNVSDVDCSSTKQTKWFGSQDKISQDDRTIQGLLKRIGAMPLETNMRKMQKRSLKKISWADQPISHNMSPRPLKEERIFMTKPEEGHYLSTVQGTEKGDYSSQDCKAIAERGEKENSKLVADQEMKKEDSNDTEQQVNEYWEKGNEKFLEQGDSHQKGNDDSHQYTGHNDDVDMEDLF